VIDKGGDDVAERLKALDAIVYTAEYIQVWPTKRPRNAHTAQSNNTDILQRWDMTYFKWNQVKEQNKVLETKWMKVPNNDDYKKSLEALPFGFYETDSRDTWLNILAYIVGMPESGSIWKDGELHKNGSDHFWSISEDNGMGYYYSNYHYEGYWDWKGSVERRGNYGVALPIRPVIK
jgi:hypothetical protein